MPTITVDDVQNHSLSKPTPQISFPNLVQLQSSFKNHTSTIQNNIQHSAVITANTHWISRRRHRQFFSTYTLNLKSHWIIIRSFTAAAAAAVFSANFQPPKLHPNFAWITHTGLREKKNFQNSTFSRWAIKRYFCCVVLSLWIHFFSFTKCIFINQLNST